MVISTLVLDHSGPTFYLSSKLPAIVTFSFRPVDPDRSAKIELKMHY